MLASLTLAVVDEHEIFRRGLVTCLTEDPLIDLVASLPTGPLSVDVDVAVVSAEAARSFDFRCPLVVCGRRPEEGNEGLRDNIILGSVSRATLTPAQLLAAVHAAAAGLRVDAEPGGREKIAGMDERALVVLRLLAEGADTQEIASSLNYSERTIKVLIQQVEHHLGARSRAQAVALGIRQGII
jgi:DNA-binding CsgD family transcriptional regulator